MAEKKAANRQSDEKSQSRRRAQNQAAKKATQKKAAKTAKKAKTTKKAEKAARKAPASKGATTGLDKSVEQFRESLERNVTLSRDRLQEVVDDAVKRGRMTRGDAEKMLSDLVKTRPPPDRLAAQGARTAGQAGPRRGRRPGRAGAQTGDAGCAPRAQKTAASGASHR